MVVGFLFAIASLGAAEAGPASAVSVAPGASASIAIPSADRPRLPLGTSPTPAEQAAGQDWYRFDFASDAPKLLYIGIDYIDRDVPPDVRVYTLDPAGKPVEYTRGIDPQSLQRERPPRPGAN